MLPPSGPRKWTQAELDALHAMVKDYEHAKWFRGQLKWWIVWILGIPSTVLMVWEPLEKLWKLFRGVPK